MGTALFQRYERNGESDMYIETESRESMERDMAVYLGVSVDRLRQYIGYAANKAQENGKCFDTEVFDSKIDSICHDLQSGNQIDRIFVYHLARRLQDTRDSYDGENLFHLLTSENSLTQYLMEHKVKFITCNNHLTVLYKGKEISLKDTSDADVCYLRSRFGFNRGREDYCFNGFALRDLLMKNSYARELYDGPEFLSILSRFLKNDSILTDFFRQSKYFCFTYQVPFNMIVFDGHEKLKKSMKEKYFVHQVCYRLFTYQGVRNKYLYDHDNPIVRFEDNATVPAEYMVKKEELSLEMLQ